MRPIEPTTKTKTNQLARLIDRASTCRQLKLKLINLYSAIRAIGSLRINLVGPATASKTTTITITTRPCSCLFVSSLARSFDAHIAPACSPRPHTHIENIATPTSVESPSFDSNTIQCEANNYKASKQTMHWIVRELNLVELSLVALLAHKFAC